MAKVVFMLVCMVSTVVPVSLAGSVAYQHRDTNLDDLKSIDRYVSSGLGLRVLENGFFIGTSRGPVLVKSKTPLNPNAPVVKSKYYNTLPRLIPAGFEGVAVSHFNLGAATPYATPKQLVAVPPYSRRFIAPQPIQQVPQPQQVYVPPQQYVAESQQPQQFVETQQPQQFVPETQQPQQYVAETEQPQQYVGEARQPQQYYTEAQQPQQFAGEAQQPQQFIGETQQPQQYLAEAQQPQQYLAEPQRLDQPQNQQIQFHQQPQFQYSSQLISEQPRAQPLRQLPPQPIDRTHSPAPVAQSSFQVDNLLRPDQDQSVTSAFQTQVFGAERFQSQRLTPNTAVVSNTEFEETLPENFRNKFYKNANLATLLAQESLPIQGEEIINEWNTNKIAKGKIHALLSGAGLI